MYRGKYTVYLAGGMTKFGANNFDEADQWRRRVKKRFKDLTDINIINPNEYFNFFQVPAYKTQREIMEFDLNRVRNSDLIIVNFNDPQSLGTMSEIAISFENRIPIIGLNENNNELHPWIIEMCNRIFTDFDEMLEYVNDFYFC